MTIDDSTHRLLDDLLESIDEKNTDRFLRFLTDDAIFRFGSAPQVQGQAEIRDTVNEFFATIAGCKHKLNNILSDDGTIVCEGEVTYIRHDETEVTLPFVNVFELEGELISHYKIYADAGPLYAEE
jgi:limonene-1,2-epoxide hydrolase